MKRHKSRSILNYLGHAGSAEGFTIIEIMVALVILSILVAIAVPMYLNSSGNADKQVARYNLRIAASCHNGMLFSLLLEDGRPSQEVYKDYHPTGGLELTQAYQDNQDDYGHFVPVDAKYMSYVEPKTSWADVAVVGGGGGGGFAAADLNYVSDGSVLADDDTPAGATFRLYNVYKHGQALLSGGSELYEAWNLLPGKIGVVENQFYWSGGWQPNTDHEYITFLTLEKAGVAHYITFRLGTILESGAFDWNNGSGNPGDAWADDDNPIADNNNPPGDTTPQPPGDTTPQPPGDTTPQPPSGGPVVATVVIEPETINLRTGEGTVTAFIYITGGGHTAADIDPSSVIVTACGARATMTNLADDKLVAKFNRSDLSGIPEGAEVLIDVSGVLNDGTAWNGSDTARVMR